MSEPMLSLSCFLLGDDSSKVFLVKILKTEQVGFLKQLIKEERSHRLNHVDDCDLTVWKVSLPVDTITPELTADNVEGRQELHSVKRISLIFGDGEALEDEYVHILVQAPIAAKRKREDPTDISQKLCSLWTKPVAPDLQHLKAYLEEPLDPDWKIPLPYNRWKEYLASELSPAQACSNEDLELLFNQSEDETAVGLLRLFDHAIIRDPVNPSGTEMSLVSFWDRNIRDILERALGVACIRDSNRGTETGKLRPGFGLLLSNVCVFRGEERRIGFGGTHPRDELGYKTRWVYDPAPYILGYYAIGSEVVLTAIVKPRAESLRVIDIISADLSSRRGRIKNAVRMIKLCGILKRLQQVIGEDKDRDMRLQLRDGGQSIEYFLSSLRKTYGLDDGKKRVEHLIAIYASLVSKGVPNVDRLKKAEIHDNVHGPYVDLEPRGINEGPKSPLDVRNAVVCVLEVLKVAHADPPVFHRDIRWPNVIQNKEDPNSWFLIDWEDASFAPTKAAKNLNDKEHSPKVFEDNHGGEVDMWGVGRLIVTARTQIPALHELGRKMMGGDILNAEQGLEEINDIQVV